MAEFSSGNESRSNYDYSASLTQSERDKTVARVIIGGERFPIVNEAVRLHIRKDGPLDINRLAQVQIPENAFGVNWYERINPQYDDADGYDRCQIEFRNPHNGEGDVDAQRDQWVPVMDGYISRMGGGDSTGSVRIEVSDFSHLLGLIPTSTSFKDASIRDILTYVKETFFANVPFSGNASVENRSGIKIEFEVSKVEAFATRQQTDKRVFTPKSFKKNRDSLLDVVKWLRERTSTRFWFEPTADGVSFVLASEPQTRSFTHLDGSTIAAKVDGYPDDLYEVGVVYNNALYEISPLNGLHARGKAEKTWSDIGDSDNVPAGKYADVVVEHPQIRKQAGERLTGPVQNVDATSQTEVENIAKSRLKDKIDSPLGGEMITLLNPLATPYDAVYLPPVINETVQKTDPQAYLPYEVERVEHVVTAEDGYFTKITPSVLAKMSDIEVVKSRIKNA